jgi:hypothetical protein
MQTQLNIDTQEMGKFRDAEHLWFWFVSIRKIRTGFFRNSDGNSRPCEIIDVETLITKLFLSGRLTKEQLGVMKDWGDKRRVPNPYVYAENRDARLWRDAFALLSAEFRKKDWLLA